MDWQKLRIISLVEGSKQFSHYSFFKFYSTFYGCLQVIINFTKNRICGLHWRISLKWIKLKRLELIGVIVLSFGTEKAVFCINFLFEKKENFSLEYTLSNNFSRCYTMSKGMGSFCAWMAFKFFFVKLNREIIPCLVGCQKFKRKYAQVIWLQYSCNYLLKFLERSREW